MKEDYPQTIAEINSTIKTDFGLCALLMKDIIKGINQTEFSKYSQENAFYMFDSDIGHIQGYKDVLSSRFILEIGGLLKDDRMFSVQF